MPEIYTELKAASQLQKGDVYHYIRHGIDAVLEVRNTQSQMDGTFPPTKKVDSVRFYVVASKTHPHKVEAFWDISKGFLDILARSGMLRVERLDHAD
jgi:hypothetical protein